MKNINTRTMRVVPKDSRHIRWNWEESPDRFQYARYHVVVVDDKRREGIFLGILQQIQRISSIETIRKVEGPVKESKLKYLFVSFDTIVAPREIDWSKTGKVVRQDINLYERKVGNIEDYVSNLYCS